MSCSSPPGAGRRPRSSGSWRPSSGAGCSSTSTAWPSWTATASACGRGTSTSTRSSPSRARSWSAVTSSTARSATRRSATWPFARPRDGARSGRWRRCAWPAAGPWCAGPPTASSTGTRCPACSWATSWPPRPPACAISTRATSPPPSAPCRWPSAGSWPRSMEDDRLADLLEELPESEQLGMIEGLDLERLLSVLEEMEVDDLADLLAEMPGEQRTQLLSAMDVEDADVLRRLLSYEEGTAGSLMTPDIIIFGPHATVAVGAGRGARPRLAGVDRGAGLRDQRPVRRADRHLPRCRPLPAAAPGTTVDDARPLPGGGADRPARHARAGGGRAPGLLQPPGRRRLRRAAASPRGHHRRRRARPHPARRLAAAARVPEPRHEGPGRGPVPSPQGTPRPRHPLRHRRLRPVQRGHRPVPRHRPLPGVPDRRHRGVDHLQHHRAGVLALRPLRPWPRAAHPACSRCRRRTPRR